MAGAGAEKPDAEQTRVGLGRGDAGFKITNWIGKPGRGDGEGGEEPAGLQWLDPARGSDCLPARGGAMCDDSAFSLVGSIAQEKKRAAENAKG